ncbi:MAG: hypothetical protein KGZ96_03300 [Clostridia bacterium]|nr:hypothetical protein [Clostridia bacterium]
MNINHLSIIHKPNFTRTGFYLKIILFLLVALAFIITGCTEKTSPKPSAPGAKFTGDDPLTRAGVVECLTCHEMKPESSMWQLSSHNKISCTTCHSDINLREKHAISNSGNYSVPIQLKTPVKNEVCEQCHSLKRTITPSGDVIIPHQFHAKLGIRCTVCHDSLVHNRIDERLPILDEKYLDFESWTAETAEELYDDRFSHPSMWTCLDCHKMMKVTTQCASCHIRIPGLPSHESPSWKTNHGVAGRDNPEECVYCHQMTLPKAPPDPSTGDEITDFARATSFCTSCHMQLPENHQGRWMPAHSKAANSKGITNCIACHDLDEPSGSSYATNTYCNRCHWYERGKENTDEKENKFSEQL